MLRIPRLKKKPGLSPGTLVHVGERHVETSRIEVIRYGPDQYEREVVEDPKAAVAMAARGGVTWINVDGVHDTAMIEALGREFHLHPLLLEDVVNTDQRAKVEDYGDYRFVVLKMLRDVGEDTIEAEQVSLVLLPNVVLTFQEGIPGDVFGPLRERIQGGKGRVRVLGPDYLAYAILDAIVDGYFVIEDRIGEEIEAVELELTRNPGHDVMSRIHRLRRLLIVLRKAVWPLREVVASFQKGDALVLAETLPFFRDLHDHTIQVLDIVESFRDVTGGLLDLYVSIVSYRMNEVMKVLTIIATIFIPLTFVVGVYGMNFQYMPELRQPWGYPAVWLVMIAMGAGMLVYFRKRGWL